jgi:uroporphyrinogen-III synthase
MLEAEGATALRCPLVRIAELDDTSEAKDWIERVITAPFDYTIFLTGDGFRKLLTIGDTQAEELIKALGKTRLVTRGPKPVRALREFGLVPSLQAAPPTSEGVLDSLAKEKLDGRRIGVQLYPGKGAWPLVEALRNQAAEVYPITPYRYATDTEAARVAQAIGDLVAGKIGMVAFTSSPQVERLFDVAQEFGLEQQLSGGLARTPIASIGPVVDQALASRGLSSTVRPQANFHLKPLVRAIIAWRLA